MHVRLDLREVTEVLLFGREGLGGPLLAAGHNWSGVGPLLAGGSLWHTNQEIRNFANAIYANSSAKSRLVN